MDSTLEIDTETKVTFEMISADFCLLLEPNYKEYAMVINEHEFTALYALCRLRNILITCFQATPYC